MISYVRGILAEIHSDSIVVEAGGIGYNIMITGMDFDILPPVGSEIKISTYFSVKEDSMQLYGFVDSDSLGMFKLLITITGLGPKGAMAILSIMTADDLRFAILSQDAKAISKAPGIGAKIAQRVILELKDKVKLEDAFETKLSKAQPVSGKSGSNPLKDDAVLALTALGYSSADSLKAVAKVEITDGMTADEVLSEAIKHLAFL